jgi:hypothetical protein
MDSITTSAVPEALSRLTKDVRLAASDLSAQEARYLVDAYYTLQDHRIEAQNQVRALTASEEPNVLLSWLFDQHYLLEKEIGKALGTFSSSRTPGVWAMSITGIGPVIAAGLLAHIDIEQAPTVGHIWSFAGLNPEAKWEKKQKRPWNARLKTLCWKIGESFVKVSGRESDIYGKVYVARKQIEIARNLDGVFADQAARVLSEKNIGKTTDAFAYYSGSLARADAETILAAPAREGLARKLAGEPGSGVAMLPPAHIHARAKRVAVKLFLAHFHWVSYESHFGELPPKPYVIEHQGHAHFIAPPHWLGGQIVIPAKSEDEDEA